MPPRRRQSPGRDERRADLLRAAQAVFAQKGYHAATVDDITRAAGVAKGTFYLYFREKREVFYEIVAGFLSLIKEIGSEVSQSSELDFFSRAEKGAHELMRIFLENRDLARLAYRESMGLDPKLEEMVRAFYRDIAEVEARNIRRGIELGLFRDVHPLLVAYAHIGMVERVLLALLDEAEDLPDPDRVVREMMQIAFDGLRKV